MSQTRYFPNPFLDYQPADTGAFQIDKEKIKSQGLEFLETALAKGAGEGDDDLYNGGLYVGATGIAYAFLHVCHLLTKEEKDKYFPFAFSAFHKQAIYYQANPCQNKSDECALILGRGGFYALGAVWGRQMGNETLEKESIASYILAGQFCKPVNFSDQGGDELFVGRAGYLLGALYIQQHLGYMPVPRQDLLDIWNAIIESGQHYAKERGSAVPLMYSYYDTEYLGAAHGLCSILQVLLAFPGFISENPKAEKLIKDTIDLYLTLQDKDGNFPCATGEIGSGERSEDGMLVQWCHGASGAVYLFAKAYLYYQEKKYLDACIKCGDAVWNKGLLRKGPGLCHGVAGNGYTFLAIYNLLEQKDPKYLYRALSFAAFLQDSQFKKEARLPDCPFSLYEGVAGTACFVLDLLQPDQAQFPFFSLFNNYIFM